MPACCPAARDRACSSNLNRCGCGGFSWKLRWRGFTTHGASRRFAGRSPGAARRTRESRTGCSSGRTGDGARTVAPPSDADFARFPRMHWMNRRRMSWRRPPRDAAPRAQDRGGFAAWRPDRIEPAIALRNPVFLYGDGRDRLRRACRSRQAVPTVPALDSLKRPCGRAPDLIRAHGCGRRGSAGVACAMIAAAGQYGLHTAIVMTLSARCRLIETAHQRSHQRDLDRGAERDRPVAGQDERIQTPCCWPAWSDRSSRHHAARLGDLTRYISLRDRRLHGRREHAAGARSAEEPARHRWRRPRPFPAAWLTLSEGGATSALTLVLALRWLKVRLARDCCPICCSSSA